MDGQVEILGGLFYSHLALSLVAVFIGVMISIPLGVYLTRRKALQKYVLGFVGVIETIPGLVFLAIMVPVLGVLSYLSETYLGFKFSSIGVLPTLVALSLYSILPILQNTVSGVASIDEAYTDAAKACGMTDSQRFLKVELHLAMPFIITGIRTATIWTIGLATLATPVGAPSLGNLIFSGLQTRNFIYITIGCFLTAVMALFFDILIGAFESAWRERKRIKMRLVGTFMTSIYLIIVLHSAGQAFIKEEKKIIIGTKAFTEQYILGDLIKQWIERETDYKVEVRKTMGGIILFEALRNDQVDIYVEYSGTVWAQIMKEEHVDPPDMLLKKVRNFLENKHKIGIPAILGFNNQYAFAMTDKHAEKLGITNVSELKTYAPDFKVGSDYVFFDRMEWRSVKSQYPGIKFKERVIMDPTLMYEVVNRKEVDVILAYTSDGRIQKYKLKILDDDQSAIPSYSAMVVVSPNRAKNDPALMSVLSKLHDKINLKTMQELNFLVDEKGYTTNESAAYFINKYLVKK